MTKGDKVLGFCMFYCRIQYPQESESSVFVIIKLTKQIREICAIYGT